MFEIDNIFMFITIKVAFNTYLFVVRLLSADTVLQTHDDNTMVPSIENLHTEKPSGMSAHVLELAVRVIKSKCIQQYLFL